MLQTGAKQKRARACRIGPIQAYGVISTATKEKMTGKESSSLSTRGGRGLRAFRRMISTLTHLSFSGPPGGGCSHPGLDLSLSDDEILFQLGDATRGTELFMGRYPPRWIRAHLERSGLLPRLRSLGFRDDELVLTTMSVDILEHRIALYDGAESADRLLVEARLREGVFRPREVFSEKYRLEPMDALVVDYLVCQNPRLSFAPHETPLPGQRRPGLGALKPIMRAILDLARGLRKEAIVNVPEHYHAALFYSPPTLFYSPLSEGKVRAMRRDLGGEDLPRLSRAVARGCLFNEAAGEYEPWRPGELIEPLAGKVRAYFEHSSYIEVRDAAEAENRYRIDWERFGAVAAPPS